MLAARLISALAALSMIATPIYAQKCTGEDYKAPYNLGETPAVIKVPSIAAPEGVYYLTPCITVNQGLCADSNDADQECYSYTGGDKKPHSQSLGAPSNTTWSTSNWADEAVATNTDFTAAETNVLCDVSLPGGYFKTVYTCIVGDDTGVLAAEPQRSTDTCVFEIHVDSSVLCNYRKTLSSSSSSSSGESSSSSSSSEESSSSSSSSEVSSSSSSSSEKSSSSSSSAVSSSSSSSEESSSSSKVKSSSSSSSGLSSSSSGFMSSSSTGADDSSSSSSVVILSSSSSSSDDMSSTADSTGDNWSSSSTGDADAGGLSLASQLGIGLGAGLGGLALILFCGLLFTCQKLRALQASKAPLLDEESQTGGRYSTIKSAEEGRGKKGNQRLV